MNRLFIILACMFLSIGTYAKERLTELPTIKYSDSPAAIKGLIKGYKASNAVDSIKISYNIFLNSDPTFASAAVAKDGTFTLEATIPYTDRVNLTYKGKTIVFEAIPGEETSLTIYPELMNEEAPKKPAYVFTGTIGDFNTDLVRYANKYDSSKLFSDIEGDNGLLSLAGLTVEQYKEKVLGIYEQASKTVMADKNLCGAFKQYVDATYKYTTMVKLLLFNSNLNAANNVGVERDKQKIVKYEAPKDYYAFIPSWNPFKSPAAYYSMTTATAVATAKFLGSYMGVDIELIPEGEEIYKAYTYAQSIANFKMLTEAEEIALDTECPHMKACVLDINNRLKERMEAAKNSKEYKIKEISADLKGEDIFKALIADYKGKPLLVDFWATWCGPCKMAMKTILPVKEELKGKANFIYITGPTSPREAWEGTIPDIHGDHYYVTQDQYQTLLKQFDSTGIPTYVIVDKEGNIVTKHIGYPGNDVIKEELTK